ncbi:MAG: DUF2726 domain-containing protein [Verrucomicrobia bacterium]|nr:MAG: DUF2726 domain-containing protein [Verrucomicrobiota bacterium]
MIPWHLYGFAITGLLLLVLFAIGARRIARASHGGPWIRASSSEETVLQGLWMFERRAAVLGAAEQRFLGELERVLRGRYRVAVHVHLGALLELPANVDPIVRARHGGALDQRLDFVLLDPGFRAVGVVVFDDPAGPGRDRGRDAGQLEAILASARIPVVRLSAGAAEDPKALWRALHDALGIG